MRGWLKEHILEIIAIALSVVGVKGIVEFGSRIREMFIEYMAESIFMCVILAGIAVAISATVSRNKTRKSVARKFRDREERSDLIRSNVAHRLKEAIPDARPYLFSEIDRELGLETTSESYDRDISKLLEEITRLKGVIAKAAEELEA